MAGVVPRTVSSDYIPLARKKARELGRKFEDGDVKTDPWLGQAAMAWLREVHLDTNRRPFEYLDSIIRDFVVLGGSLTTGQIRGVLNCLRADELRRPTATNILTLPQAMGSTSEDDDDDPGIPEARPRVTSRTPVKVGTYTVCLNGDENDRVTIRIKTHWEEDAASRGELVATYLMGPENESDYQGFAFIRDGRAFPWAKYRRHDNSRLTIALEYLIHMDPSDRATAGYTWAIESGRCYRCGRELTVPASIRRGLGPHCAGEDD